MVATIYKPLYKLVSVAESCDSLLNRKRQVGKVCPRVGDQDLLGRRCSNLSLGVAKHVASGKPALSPPQGQPQLFIARPAHAELKNQPNLLPQ